MDVVAIRKRLRSFDQPPTPGQLQSAVVVGIGLLVSAPFFIWIQNSEDPVGALGLALQTLCGLVASVRLWANGSADATVSWIARQIGKGRLRGLGLLDGRALSMVLAGGCYVLASHTANLLWMAAPPGLVGLLVALPALFLLVAGFALFVLAMLMFAGAVLAPADPLPDGEALTGVYSRLADQDWVWPLLGLAIVAGGFMQMWGG